jgi:hypothetical protein
MGYFMVVKRKPDVIIEKVNKKLKGIKEVKHNHNLQQYQLEQYQRNLELERRIQNNLRR